MSCKTGLVKSLSQIKDEKIMFSLAQVMEVTESEACVSEHHRDNHSASRVFHVFSFLLKV